MVLFFQQFKFQVLVVAIIFFAAIVRLFALSQIPGSLNQDEVALGYNAYSLLKTGADEHGVFLPIALESFGDWKLPGYSYIAALSVAVFGLTEFSVRLPSALSGIIGVFLIYKVSILFFHKRPIGLLAAFFFAVSPWSVHFSRAAYEVNIATTFLLAGLYFFLRFTSEKKSASALLLASLVLFSATLFAYHSYIFFTPLFVLMLLILFRKHLVRNYQTIGSILLFALLCGVAIWSTLSVGSDKVSTLFVFNDPNVIYSRVEKFRENTPENALMTKLIHNRYVGGVYHIAQNYVGAFSPSFLFDRGGEKLQHNVEGIGNLYLFDAFLLMAGLAGLFFFKEKSVAILIVWVILAPIPSAITLDTPNSTRLFLLQPLFILIASYGAYVLYNYAKSNRLLRVGVPVAILLITCNIFYFLDLYFTHFNSQRVRFWRYGYEEVINIAKKHPDSNIVIRGPENFPYIYALFYEQYDPARFRQAVQYYPRTEEGFLYVHSFGRYTFVQKIDYNSLQKNTIYFDDVDVKNLPHRIALPSGEPVVGYTVSN